MKRHKTEISMNPATCRHHCLTSRVVRVYSEIGKVGKMVSRKVGGFDTMDAVIEFGGNVWLL